MWCLYHIVSPLFFSFSFPPFCLFPLSYNSHIGPSGFVCFWVVTGCILLLWIFSLWGGVQHVFARHRILGVLKACRSAFFGVLRWGSCPGVLIDLDTQLSLLLDDNAARYSWHPRFVFLIWLKNPVFLSKNRDQKIPDRPPHPYSIFFVRYCLFVLSIDSSWFLQLPCMSRPVRSDLRVYRMSCRICFATDTIISTGLESFAERQIYNPVRL